MSAAAKTTAILLPVGLPDTKDSGLSHNCRHWAYSSIPTAMNKGTDATTSKALDERELGSGKTSQAATGQVTKVSAATFHFTATVT